MRVRPRLGAAENQGCGELLAGFLASSTLGPRPSSLAADRDLATFAVVPKRATHMGRRPACGFLARTLGLAVLREQPNVDTAPQRTGGRQGRSPGSDRPTGARRSEGVERPDLTEASRVERRESSPTSRVALPGPKHRVRGPTTQRRRLRRRYCPTGWRIRRRSRLPSRQSIRVRQDGGTDQGAPGRPHAS